MTMQHPPVPDSFRAVALGPLRAATLVAGTLLFAAGSAQAQTIDFETVPGVGTPNEGDSISTQFLASHGVSFALEGGGFPVIAEVGAPRTAFAGPPSNMGNDNALAGQDTGSLFLTDDGLVAGPPDPLIVSYSVPVTALSGVIIDIDGTEAWELEARNAADAVLATVCLAAGGPNTGDGVATPWFFSLPTGLISSLRIRYTGVQQVVGLAFDNFSPTTAPAAVPVASPLGLVALAALLGGAAVFVLASRRPRGAERP